MIEIPLLCWNLYLGMDCRAIRVQLPEQQKPSQKLTSLQVCTSAAQNRHRPHVMHFVLCDTVFFGNTHVSEAAPFLLCAL